jgi:hypothetical protein
VAAGAAARAAPGARAGGVGRRRAGGAVLGALAVGATSALGRLHGALGVVAAAGKEGAAVDVDAGVEHALEDVAADGVVNLAHDQVVVRVLGPGGEAHVAQVTSVDLVLDLAAKDIDRRVLGLAAEEADSRVLLAGGGNGGSGRGKSQDKSHEGGLGELHFEGWVGVFGCLGLVR